MEETLPAAKAHPMPSKGSIAEMGLALVTCEALKRGTSQNGHEDSMKTQAKTSTPATGTRSTSDVSITL